MNTEEKTLQIFESLFTSVVVIDANMRINYMNSAAENLLSVSLHQALGHTLAELFPGSEHLHDMVRRTFTSRQPFLERGLMLALPNSISLAVDISATPMVDKSNREACEEVIVEMIDANTSTRFMREENLARLSNAAKESIRGMAHEIKNPLGGLRGAAQLLERELNGNDLKEYTTIIISEADRLRNLIDRMVAPDSNINVTTVNIHEILEYVYNLVVADSPATVQIEKDYDPSLPDLDADREQLIQALLNVLLNAVEAIPVAGHIWINTRIKRMCTIRQHQYKLAVQIEIIDDGPGVPVEIENSIFYPMVTGRAEGTGLGLSISQSLVQAHGGIIEYERCDSRTIFRILLPIQPRHD